MRIAINSRQGRVADVWLKPCLSASQKKNIIILIAVTKNFKAMFEHFRLFLLRSPQPVRIDGIIPQEEELKIALLSSYWNLISLKETVKQLPLTLRSMEKLLSSLQYIAVNWGNKHPEQPLILGMFADPLICSLTVLLPWIVF